MAGQIDQIRTRTRIVARCIQADPNDSYDRDDLPRAAQKQSADVGALLSVLEEVQDIYSNLDVSPEQLAFAMWDRVERFREAGE